LVDEADDQSQVNFLKGWFAEYKNNEESAYIKWFKHAQTFNIQIEG
jgi:hypothetical protein